MERAIFASIAVVTLLVPISVAATLPHSAESVPILSDPRAKAGPLQVIETLDIWHDASRDRDVPVKIYAPASGGPFPLVIFSHGLGSSRNGYAYLGRHWASHGYVVVHVQHLGSDSEVLRTRGRWAIFRAAYRQRNWIDRPLDVTFVIDELQRRERAGLLGPFANSIDFHRIGVAGHSFGAHTALEIAGLLVNFSDQKGRSFRDPRVIAAIALSPPPMEASPTEFEYRLIDVPVLSMTGTRDASLVFRTTVANRRRPFERIHRADQYLVTIDDAVHRTFADLETEHDAMEAGRLDGPPGPQTRPPGGAEHQAHLGIIRGVTLVFWDAMLRGDEDAVKWLREGGAQKALGTAARFEKK